MNDKKDLPVLDELPEIVEGVGNLVEEFQEFGMNDDSYDSTEKNYEDIFVRDNIVYFLEVSGTWHKFTCKDEATAKKMFELYTE